MNRVVASLLTLLAATAPAPEGSPDAAGVPFTGRMVIQLAVKDLDRSLAFYEGRLGFTVEARIERAGFARVALPADGVALGLKVHSDPRGSGSATINLGVDDVDAARLALEARGVRFVAPTRDLSPSVRMAEFADPDGNRFRLTGRPARPTPGPG